MILGGEGESVGPSEGRHGDEVLEEEGRVVPSLDSFLGHQVWLIKPPDHVRVLLEVLHVVVEEREEGEGSGAELVLRGEDFLFEVGR